MILTALTQSQAAALLTIAPRTLRDWPDAPRNGDGSYNGPLLVAYYVAKLTGGGEFDNQRERLAAAQAEKVEMDNAVRRGQLAEIPTVERFWGECIGNARTRIMGIGSKLGPQLVNIADASVISAAIRAEARAALAELADFDPGCGDLPEGGDSPGKPRLDASAGPDGEPVGRPRKKAQQRKQRGAGAVAD